MPHFRQNMCTLCVLCESELFTVFAFLSCWFVLLMPLGSNSVEIEETCAKPFLFLIGLGMFFNSMNLDLINGGRHFGSRFQGLLVI